MCYTTTNTVGKKSSSFKELNSELSAYIISILKRYSTFNNPIEPAKVLEYINLDLPKLAKLDSAFNTTKVTITKKLDNLYTLSHYYSELFCQLYGGYVHKYYLVPQTSRKRNHPEYIKAEVYENEYSSIADFPKNIKTFYCFESQFTAKELMIIKSSIETNPYISKRESRTLMNKLSNSTTQELINDNTVKSMNNTVDSLLIPSDSAKLLNNISILIDYMKNDYQIEINYGKYVYDKQQHNVKLVPRKTPANWQRIDPISILDANGFYYLIAHTDKSSRPNDVISYRIDRIIDIDIHKDAIKNKPLLMDKDLIQYRDNFSSMEYLKSHPVMYSGDTVAIRMLVMDSNRFSAINSLIDTFGTDFENNIVIYELKESETLKYLGETLEQLNEKGEHWYMVHLNHYSAAGTILWAKQHIEAVKIISPDEVVNALIEAVTKGLKRYS